MSDDAMLIPVTEIEPRIMLLRGQKLMLDRDLAGMYGVRTGMLKRTVRRNAGRFPEDFMFVLNDPEIANWRRQFGTSKSERMGLRYVPMAFPGPVEQIITYAAPFDRCDREQDHATAWKEFEKRGIVAK